MDDFIWGWFGLESLGDRPVCDAYLVVGAIVVSEPDVVQTSWLLWIEARLGTLSTSITFSKIVPINFSMVSCAADVFQLCLAILPLLGQ